MTSQRLRVWGLAAGALLVAAVGWYVGSPSEGPPEPAEEPTDDAPSPSADAPPILRNSATETSDETVAATDVREPPTPLDDGPRPAPGAASWAQGEDLPPPAVPDEPPAVDPEHLRYREAAENVSAATQVNYLERSMVLLDTSITALEARHARDPESVSGQRLGVRLERLRLSRRERQVELDAMRVRAAAEPPAAEEPSAPEAMSEPQVSSEPTP